MSVRPFNTLSSEHSMLTFSGYVKEQSLRGIIEWFDFWLEQ
jgi:hypothetical protein